MRILHTSDWHVGRLLENISRIEEQRQFIDELCRITEDQRIDLVLIAGDIYDTYNPSAAAEELFYQAVDRLSGKGKRAVAVIAGNHDNPERLCAASPLARRNGIILLGYPGSDAGTFRSKDGQVEVLASGKGWFELRTGSCSHSAVILTMPYPSESRLDEVLTEEADEGLLQQAYSDRIGSILRKLSGNFRKDTVNLIVGHMFFKGGYSSESERTIQVGGALTVDPAVIPSNTHYAAFGHLHRPQQVGDAPCPAFYSGSPLAYSFSEADYSKAVYIIDAEPGKEARVEKIHPSSGRPLRRWVAKNGINEALRWFAEGRDTNAWIDVEIYTDRVLSIEEQRALRELNPGIINIRPVLKEIHEVETAAESREGRRIDELFMDFYRFKTGTEASDELMGEFLEVVNQMPVEEEKEGGDGVEAQIS